MNAYLSLLIGVVCAGGGGELFVRGLVGLARWAKVSAGIIGTTVADGIEKSGHEARVTILGHLQRSAPPTPADRILATRFGAAAIDMVGARKFGRMCAVRGGRITSLPLARVAGRVKLVPRDHELVLAARAMGSSFGDEGAN